MHLELLAPLDVVSDCLHVDAGPGNVEVVDDLHGLELEQPRTAKPRKDDVLRHLAVRTSCRTDGCRRWSAEELEGEVDVVGRLPDSRRREIEDPLARCPFVVDPPKELVQRHRREWRCFGHESPW